MEYINLNAITKNWVGFVKIHLKYSYAGGITLLEERSNLHDGDGEWREGHWEGREVIQAYH